MSDRKSPAPRGGAVQTRCVYNENMKLILLSLNKRINELKNKIEDR